MFAIILVVAMNTTNDINVFQTIGLSDNEISVFKGHLKYGSCAAAEMARYLNLDKSSTYRAAEELHKKRLLTKDNKIRGTKYTAANPDILTELYDEKLAELNTQRSGLDSIVEMLKETTKYSNTSVSTRIFRGLSGQKESMELTLNSMKKGQTMKDFFSLKNPIYQSAEYDEFVLEYIERRIKKGVRVDFITYEHEFLDKKWMSLDPDRLKRIRLFPGEWKADTGLRVAGEYVSLTTHKDGESVIILIKDAIIARVIEQMYDFIWDKSIIPS